jgi:uncharacterized membrane protein (DUF4010 family)
MTPSSVPEALSNVLSWPYIPVLSRLGLAAAMGLFIGLEREHSQKRGVRTFALTGLFGGLGGLMGTPFAAIVMGITAMSIWLMNTREMTLEKKLTLTTSTSLAIVAFVGILFGQGHVFAPSLAGIATAAFLAWKRPISNFGAALSDAELRSAILLAILSFVIFPVLPTHPVDPWGLVQPRENWASVIIIAGLGFINYILLKILGPRGMEITAFFGGLVNSRKIIVELSIRLRQLGDAVLSSVKRGIMLATGAMIIRNGLIVALLASAAAFRCIIPLSFMLLVAAIQWWRIPAAVPTGATSTLSLESPFQLSAALKFGLVFLVLNVAGALAQRHFGSASFYFVSVAGGLLSSASSIASAATLISHHEIPESTGINGIILSTLTSILANIPLIRGMMHAPEVKNKICVSLVLIALAGLAGVAVNELAWRFAPGWLPVG